MTRAARLIDKSFRKDECHGVEDIVWPYLTGKIRITATRIQCPVNQPFILECVTPFQQYLLIECGSIKRIITPQNIKRHTPVIAKLFIPLILPVESAPECRNRFPPIP